MGHFPRLFLRFLSFGVAADLMYSVSSAAVRARDCKAKKALYFITNENENGVAALQVGANGLLTGLAEVTPTKGAGASAIDGATGQPAGPDALVSQSALTIVGGNLFAVNAGSNTVSMFAIDPTDPLKLIMVGQPAALPGEFPNTVAASSKSGLVCVGMTGAKAGISCAAYSAQGIGKMDSLRLINLNQTTPPAGPTNTVSQVFFSGDESRLFATVKGDPTKNNTGFLSTFMVQARGNDTAAGPSVVQMGVNSSPSGTAVLFGAQAVSGSATDVFVTDASFGGASLGVDPVSGVASVTGKAAIQGQKATCWATISPATGTAFVTDVGMDRMVEMSINNATILNEIDLSRNGDPGLIDLKAAGGFVYALSPGNGTIQAAITVVDALKRKQVQHVQMEGIRVGKSAQGMAFFG